MRSPFIALLALLVFSSTNAAEPITADTLFAPDHLMQVEVTMDPDDWQSLRISHRVTGENFTQIVEKPYDYYHATVVIDGQEIGEVGIRKKGFFGSAISPLAFATDPGPLPTGRGRKPAGD